VLTISLALVVLALVTIGLRAAGGGNKTADVVEVPSRRDSVPTTQSPSTSSPSTSPSTTTPAAGGSTTSVPKVDTTTPRVKVNDQDGRFEVTVPRSWLNVPTASGDQNQWSLLAQAPDGTLGQTPFIFAVRWAASEGCTLEQCAAQVVARIDTTFPGVTAATASDSVGGLSAVRIDATAADQRVVAWVVVKGDRYWVVQLRGPVDGFETMLGTVRVVVASMSFG